MVSPSPPVLPITLQVISDSISITFAGFCVAITILPQDSENRVSSSLSCDPLKSMSAPTDPIISHRVTARPPNDTSWAQVTRPDPIIRTNVSIVLSIFSGTDGGSPYSSSSSRE